MNLIKSFFQNLWLYLDNTNIPIIDCTAKELFLSVFAVVILIECINKILSKESGDGK